MLWLARVMRNTKRHRVAAKWCNSSLYTTTTTRYLVHEATAVGGATVAGHAPLSLLKLKLSQCGGQVAVKQDSSNGGKQRQ